ncbi:hypothetical protein V492_08087 [Pseudogymnoascus sp. VKM F-4246]|nr:hypothetical protein V492_08087 [Pseudogymnoascus sp. VKM F-4246]
MGMPTGDGVEDDEAEGFEDVETHGRGVEKEDEGEAYGDGEVDGVEDAVAACEWNWAGVKVLDEVGTDEEVEIEARVETEEGDDDSAEDAVIGVELFMGEAEEIS